MDHIVIRDMLVNCILGARDHERDVKQPVLISVSLSLDLRPAGQSDRLDDTVDYSSLVKRIMARAEVSHYHLVEALAQAVADLCLAEPGVLRVKVRVSKPGAARRAKSIWVEIIRKKE